MDPKVVIHVNKQRTKITVYLAHLPVAMITRLSASVEIADA